MDKLPTKAQLILVALLGVLLFFGGVKYQHVCLEVIEVEDCVDEEEKQESYEPVFLTVHVVGAVEKEGVYTLPEGARVNDAVQLAKPTAEADLNSLNLALVLADGKQIYVPAKGEKIQTEDSFAISTRPSGKININTAGKELLEALPGIGPVLAERIVEYRQSNGLFSSIDSITNVSGIGSVVLNKIKDKITVD